MNEGGNIAVTARSCHSRGVLSEVRVQVLKDSGQTAEICARCVRPHSQSGEGSRQDNSVSDYFGELFRTDVEDVGNEVHRDIVYLFEMGRCQRGIDYSQEVAEELVSAVTGYMLEP